MMYCQSCQKHEATVHTTQMVYAAEGTPSYQELHLCPPCAKTSGVPLLHIPSFPKMVSMLGKAILGNAGPPTPSSTQCPDCGWTLKDFKQTSRFGCPQDYEVFSEFVEDILDNIHGFTQHVTEKADTELIELQGQLKQAVQQEDYESAASLRDAIQTLKRSLEFSDK